MGFSRQECWSGCHFLLQRIFLTWGLNTHLLSALQEDSLPTEPPGKPIIEEYTTLPSGMGLSAPRILRGSIWLEKNDWTLGGADEGKRLLSTSGDQPTCGFWCPRYPLSQSALKCPFQAETEKKKKTPQPADMNNKIESNKYIQSFLRQQNSPDLSPQALQAVITPLRDTRGRLQSGWGGSSGVNWPGCQPQSWLSPLLAGPVKLLILPVPPGPHPLSEETNRTCCTAVGGFEENTGNPWSGVWHILNTPCSGYCCYVCCSLTASWRVSPVYGPRRPHALAGRWHDYYVG